MSRGLRLRAWGAALLALSGSFWVGGTRAEPVMADQAPQAWIDYAQLVSQRLQGALAGDSEPAQRFAEFFRHWAVTDADTGLDASVGAGPLSDALPSPEGDAFDAPTLRVRVWLDRIGHVARVEFDPVDDDRAGSDLRALLLAQTVGRAPPRRMRQPVIVRLALRAEL
ncbi:hypothetical protein [Paraburkholderia sp.]|uniref:hypothetical protein n=1 Tax=Paraburkholderia sp. TaxID=1926495 RepID=UPI00261BAA21|nr:hypothetical protein [Paraburkholderia sp.]